jgi:hypothetical protein
MFLQYEICVTIYKKGTSNIKISTSISGEFFLTGRHFENQYELKIDI